MDGEPSVARLQGWSDARRGGAEREPVERGEVVGRLRATGRLEPGKMGGHVRPKIAGEHRAWLLQRTGQADFTIAAWSPSWPNAVCAWTTERLEIRAPRRAELQKQRWRPSRTGPTWPASGPMEDASGQA